MYQQEGLEQKDFQTVLRAAGETETTQENIQDWLQLDEGDPGFQRLVFLQFCIKAVLKVKVKLSLCSTN
jgi:hypothetical protein